MVGISLEHLLPPSFSSEGLRAPEMASGAFDIHYYDRLMLLDLRSLSGSSISGRLFGSNIEPIAVIAIPEEAKVAIKEQSWI